MFNLVSTIVIFPGESDQGTFTPIGAQGRFHWTPPKKTTFPPEFCNEMCTIYVWTIKNYNSAKKKINK